MYRIIIALWFAAAGSSALAGDSANPSNETGNHATGEEIAAAAEPISVDLQLDRTAAAASRSVVAVTSLKRLPDGSLVRQCDVVSPGRAGGLSDHPRGHWVEAPEARIR